VNVRTPSSDHSAPFWSSPFSLAPGRVSRHRLASAAAGLFVAVGLAACGSASSPGSAPSSTAAAGSTSPSLAAVRARIAHYTQDPSWVPPGPAIDPARLSGKKILVIPSSSAIPFCSDLSTDMASVARPYGVTVTQYANQGEPSQWVAGMDQALSTHVNLVDLTCGLNPSSLGPQIAQLKAAGIDVVSAHAYDPSQPPMAGLSGVVYAQYNLVGQLEADWAILQTSGHGNIFVVSDEGDVSTPPLLAGMRSQFAQYCRSCTISYVYIPIPDWSTKIEPAVAAKISSDPGLDFIIPIGDGMVQYVMPAMVAAGVTGRIHVGSFNATPSVIQTMQSGSTVTFDVGEDFPWLLRAILDQDFRVLLHVTPSRSEYAPLRIFTKQNAGDAGHPPSFQNGYGNAASINFATLWKG
jgi:ribose transport system substrate-binding protein